MRLADRLRELAEALEVVPLAAGAVDAVAQRMRNLAAVLDGWPGSTPTTCAGPECGRSIVWVTLAGKPHPCDPPIRSVVTDDGRVVRGRESHYATCPNAADFRR